ncbi:MAG: sugar ABC transporter ATP-binding protein, partial [Verrucomicrobiota bacterium]
MPLRLRMSGVSKRFGVTRALRHVSLDVEDGEIHALIGENGAGKSTLMKVLSGVHRPDTGSIELDGRPFVPQAPLHALQAGIRMIYQELNLAPDLTVEENISLGAEVHRWGWSRRSVMRERAREALAKLDHDDIPLNRPVYSLNIAQQQIVEIARACIGNPRVLIMDEPTSSLTRIDAERLFGVIRRLKEQGVSVIYISHFLEECKEVCDRYTVLRDGESVATGEMAEASLPEMIQHMVGREIESIYTPSEHELGETVFALKNLSGIKKPRAIDLSLREGEIFGVAGLVGAGRTEMLRVCFGLDRLEEGEVLVFRNEHQTCTPTRRLAEGVGMLSENRKEEGLLLNRSLADNLTLTRFGPVSRWGFIDRRRHLDATRRWMDRLEVKAETPSQTMAELSGGNQQKIAIGRLLHHEAKILLLDEPTRGIDVGSKMQIYTL